MVRDREDDQSMVKVEQAAIDNIEQQAVDLVETVRRLKARAAVIRHDEKGIHAGDGERS